MAFPVVGRYLDNAGASPNQNGIHSHFTRVKHLSEVVHKVSLKRIRPSAYLPRAQIISTRRENRSQAKNRPGSGLLCQQFTARAGYLQPAAFRALKSLTERSTPRTAAAHSTFRTP